MSGFPLLLIPLAICNIIAFLMRDVGFDVQLFALPLPSGAVWKVALGDSLVAFALVLLLLEVQKSARVGGKYVTDHLLSLLIFGAAAAEFVMLPQFANATFFLLTLIAMVDFLGGLGLRARYPRRARDAVVAAPSAPESAAPPTSVIEPVPVPAAPPPPPVSHVEPVPPRVEPIIDTRIEPTIATPRVPDETEFPPRPAPQPREGL